MTFATADPFINKPTVHRFGQSIFLMTYGTDVFRAVDQQRRISRPVWQVTGEAVPDSYRPMHIMTAGKTFMADQAKLLFRSNQAGINRLIL